MAGVFKVSDAASLALHAMSFLAARGGGGPVSTRDIAVSLGVSEAHLSKVFQRLSRLGLAGAVRGPGGGVLLAKPARDITLLDIYEAIDGPMDNNHCLLGRHSCDYKECILGDMVGRVNDSVREELKNTRLSDLSGKLVPARK